MSEEKIDMMSTLALDLSVNDLGWAFYYEEDWKVGCLHPYGEGLVEKMHSVGTWLMDEFIEPGLMIEELVIEWPQFFDSERGRIAARRGDLQGICGLAGYIIAFIGLHASRIHLYTPNVWKGTVDKSITAKKFMRKFDVDKKYNDHIIDAIMLAHYHLWERK